MNLKNFIGAGIAGGFVNFLLGWLFYGFLFKDIYPESPNMKLHFVFLGCMTFGFFISFIFTRWARIINFISGLKAGAVIGLFMALYMNFFMSSNTEPNYQNIIIDLLISIFLGAIVGGVIAFVNRKLS